MGLLDGYFVPLHLFHLTPDSFEQKVCVLRATGGRRGAQTCLRFPSDSPDSTPRTQKPDSEPRNQIPTQNSDTELRTQTQNLDTDSRTQNPESRFRTQIHTQNQT